MARRGYWSASGLIILASILLSLASLDAGYDWNGDFAQYVMQARSLADGTTQEFIEENRFTVLHSRAGLGPVSYPWGVPVLLLPVYLVSGLELMPMKLVGAACFWLLLIVLAAVARRWLPAAWALVLLAFTAFNPYVFELQNHVGSDLPFALASFATLALIGRVVVDGRRIVSRRWDAVAIGVGMGVAQLMRPNAVALLPALAAAQILVARRGGSGEPEDAPQRRIDPSDAIPYLIFVAILLLSSLLTAPDSTIPRILEGFGPRLLENIGANAADYAADFLKYLQGVPAGSCFAWGLACFALVGLRDRPGREAHWVVFALGCVAILLLFPYQGGARMWLPIMPVYLYFALAGLLRVLEWLPPKVRAAARSGALVVAAIVPIALGVRATGLASENLSNGRSPGEGAFTPLTSEMFEFVRERTPVDARILFFKPRFMRLRAERASFTLTDPAHLEMADYIVVNASKVRRLGFESELIESLLSEGRIEPVWSNVRFDVYARVQH